jgi:hypothetical protein
MLLNGQFHCSEEPYRYRNLWAEFIVISDTVVDITEAVIIAIHFDRIRIKYL